MSAELAPELPPLRPVPAGAGRPASAHDGWLSDDELHELLRRSARGDEAAFMEFYDATCNLAWRFALRRGHTRTAAEAATRRRFVIAWRRASEQASSGLSPRAWLLGLPSAPLEGES